MANYTHLRFCGCSYILPNEFHERYLPQIKLHSHTTILATTSKTVLTQTFVDPLQTRRLQEVRYTFPLYDGVSVAGFTCKVGSRTIVGLVKERNQARTDYQEAISQGQTAGLLEQSIHAADVFTTSIGNVDPGESIEVQITYLGELKNDAESDGARFTIPTQIAPRYGSVSSPVQKGFNTSAAQGIEIMVDVALERGAAIRGIQSSSHPIAVTMGRTSQALEDDNAFESNLGSATLSLGSTILDKDFVVVVSAKGQDTPRAMLETHPKLPNHRALMATLVPRFNIPNESPEIVFVVDRSGSMGGKMHLVSEAMKVFLKSLPLNVKFNICSFGSSYSFLFDKSKTYDAHSLEVAMQHVHPNVFTASYGGTEMLQPIKQVLARRYNDLPLEIMLLTDGEIWNQDVLFELVNDASAKNARFFTLGIGHGASSSLVEGVARAGRGFSQWVNDGERMEKRLIRMLKGALTPHIKYKLEVKYEAPPDYDSEDFEIIESFDKSMQLVAEPQTMPERASGSTKKKISLFDAAVQDEPTNPPTGRYDGLPTVDVPHVLQVPHSVPDLYPHSRMTVYLLLGPDSPAVPPSSVILRGESAHGDLELAIDVQDIGSGDTIHKLAAKKAMQDLEEGRGWLLEAQVKDGSPLKSKHESKWDLIVEREAVRLGTTFQVGGKFCSFVAIDAQNKSKSLSQNHPNMLADHQMSLMTLRQEKKKSTFSNKISNAAFGGMFGRASHKDSKPTSTSLFGSSHQASPAAFGSPPPSGGFGNSAMFSMAPPPPAPRSQSQALPQARARSQGFGGGRGGAGSLADESYEAPNPQQNARKDARKMFSLRSGANIPPPPPQKSAPVMSASFIPAQNSFSPGVGVPPLAFGSAPPAPPAPSAQAFYDPTICDDSADSSVPAAVTLPHLSVMQKLIDLQTFTGYWQVTSDLLAILRHNAVDGNNFKDESTLQHLVAINLPSPGDEDSNTLSSETVATLCAVAWLQAVVADEEDVWEMVVGKATSWLEGKIDGSETINEIVSRLRATWKT